MLALRLLYDAVTGDKIVLLLIASISNLQIAHLVFPPLGRLITVGVFMKI